IRIPQKHRFLFYYPSFTIAEFNQIPEVAVQIFKYRHRSVFLDFGLTHKVHAVAFDLLVITGKIIRFKKKKHAAAGLIANSTSLLVANPFRKQKLTGTGPLGRDK